MNKDPNLSLKIYRSFNAGNESGEENTKLLKLLINRDVSDGTEWLDAKVEKINRKCSELFEDFATVELSKVIRSQAFDTRSFLFHAEFYLNFKSKASLHKFKLMYATHLDFIRENMLELQEAREKVQRRGEIVAIPTAGGYDIELFILDRWSELTP